MPGTYISPAETGLYYLQSRYYNPEIGRFINADGLVATGQGILGNNMFVYCGNNPVMYVDPTGHIFQNILHNIQVFTEKLVRFAKLTAEAVVLMINPTALVHDGNNFTTYAGESDMSVIARMLYGEDHTSVNEHMWILENRRIAGGYGGSDFRTLILAKNQFSCMPDHRSLDPASHFDEAGEREAWYACVNIAYLYILYGMDAIALPHADFDYTYTHAYSDAIKNAYPDGEKYGGTWFYNK